MQRTILCLIGTVVALALPVRGSAESITDQPQSVAAAHAAFAGDGDVAAAHLGSTAFDENACFQSDASTAVADTPPSRAVCRDTHCPRCYQGLIDQWLTRDPFKLPQPRALQALGINTGGWVQVGSTLNTEDPESNYNGPLLTNDRAGNLQLNQLWTYFHRPVETGNGFDIGGRVDLLYGSDWRAAYCLGLGMEGDLDHALLNGSNQFYGFSIPQFYAEAAFNKLSVKAGRMTDILGYEMIPPMGNFFYSHAYTLCYGEPVLITGVMGNYQVSEQLNILAGGHQGVHRFEDNNDSWNFQGGVTWHDPDNILSLAYALDVGRNDFLFPLEDEYIHSLVMKLQVTENLLYVLQNDLGTADGAPNGSDAEWYSINQYLLYTLNEKWSAGARIEWFRDDDGTRVFGLANLDAKGWDGAPGFHGSFTELTLGLNYKPKSNIIVRPEMRWDWYTGSTNNGGELPFDDGNSSEQLTLATDLIVTF